MHKKFELNRTKIKGAISCQSEGGQVSLVFSVLYNCLKENLTSFKWELAKSSKTSLGILISCLQISAQLCSATVLSSRRQFCQNMQAEKLISLKSIVSHLIRKSRPKNRKCHFLFSASWSAESE